MMFGDVRMPSTFANLIRGAVTVMELMPRRRRRNIGRAILRRSDLEALRSDWYTVGDHLSAAIRQALAELPERDLWVILKQLDESRPAAVDTPSRKNPEHGRRSQSPI
jgi:hypothetical protein